MCYSSPGIRTNAKKDGDDWIINGSKIYITNGWLTDSCIVVAKVGPARFSLVLYSTD